MAFSEMDENRIDYRGKKILAPMVRVGTLPMRLLALDYGADLVYTEEIVDRKMLDCKRSANDVLHTIDFGTPEDKYPVFRTCAAEKGKVVFQMGTCDPEKALAVARLVQDDVAAVDVNMGCPKSFSLLGGMGAALLSQPEKVEQILSTLVSGISKPVTCKIRILPKLEDTLALCSTIEKCGVSALTVHGRTKDERPRHANHNDVIQEIARMLQIPVIANGGSREISCYEDIEEFRRNTGAASVMIARSAMWNVSIFRSQGVKSLEEVIDEYLRYAVKYENCPNMTKYTIQQMLQDQQHTTERGRMFLDSPAVMRDICRIWDLSAYYDKEVSRQRDRAMRSTRTTNIHGCLLSEDEAETDVFSLSVPFIRKHFGAETPKSILHGWIRKRGLENPTYETRQRPSDKKHSTVVTIQKHRFGSLSWESSKKYSEQASAFAALLIMGIEEEELPDMCKQDIQDSELQLERVRFRRLCDTSYANS